MGRWSRAVCPKHPMYERGFCTFCSHGKRREEVPTGTFKVGRNGQLKRKR